MPIYIGSQQVGFEDAPAGAQTYGRQNGEWVDLASAAALQFRQGTNADRLAMSPVPAAGEPIYTTDGRRLFIGDGITVGGRGILCDTDSYVLCQPGDNIQEMYARAKLLTPGGAALSATNRARLIVLPGVYSVNTQTPTSLTSENVGLLIDTDFVDLIGVGASLWQSSFRITGSFTTVLITANNVVVVGMDCTISIPGAGGDNRFLIYCTGTHVYSCPLLGFVDNKPNVISGSLIGCRAVTSMAGLSSGATNIFTGTVQDCFFNFGFGTVVYQGVCHGGVCTAASVSSTNSPRSMQGRFINTRFINLATASLMQRSQNKLSIPAAYTGTCTISQASPAVITKTSHNLFSGVRIRFGTTGSLPNGLNTTTTYFVNLIDSNTFSVAATRNGDSINTTSAGSGDHSILIPPGVEGGRYSFVATSDGEFTTS